jgi:hypothetical protein
MKDALVYSVEVITQTLARAQGEPKTCKSMSSYNGFQGIIKIQSRKFIGIEHVGQQNHH